MKAFVAGIVLGIVLIGVGFYFYMTSGKAPVATSDPPMPMEAFFAHAALHARIQKDYPRQVPVQPDENLYMTGVQVFRDNCAMCHGLPNQPESAAAKGMFPHPPQLWEPNHMVTDDPPGMTYWKAKNGIRLSGMPGFHASLNDRQLWAVSLLLANADKLPATVTQDLSVPSPTGTVAPPGK
ncbi:MAG TPA: cytochrome c [Terriglobia bacterium]|nr:cytochrome c [Terriglobia bacterium]